MISPKRQERFEALRQIAMQHLAEPVRQQDLFELLDNLEGLCRELETWGEQYRNQHDRDDAARKRRQ